MGIIFEQSTKNSGDLSVWLKSLKVKPSQLVRAQQVHGSRIAVVGEKDWGKVIAGVDGLVTKTLGTVLAVRTADCFPVGFTDEANGVIGIAHCGWRGIVAGVVENLIKTALAQGAKIEDLKVFIGAGIGPCHFEVQADVSKLFSKSFEERGGKTFVDLGKEIGRRLAMLGIKRENVHRDSRCTFCSKEHDDLLFFSWRRERLHPMPEMVSAIALV